MGGWPQEQHRVANKGPLINYGKGGGGYTILEGGGGVGEVKFYSFKNGGRGTERF